MILRAPSSKEIMARLSEYNAGVLSVVEIPRVDGLIRPLDSRASAVSLREILLLYSSPCIASSSYMALGRR